jgi:hypothetical protein
MPRALEIGALLNHRDLVKAPEADDRAARAKWMGWQQAHQHALDNLQAALAAYHRLTAEQAFGRDDEKSRLRRVDALARLEELRRRLDQVRDQRPTED